MSIQIPEISSETSKNDTVKSVQLAEKKLTEFFDYVNDNHPSIGEICRKYKFDEIDLKTKK